MLKLSEKELVTVSDDCSLKFWNAQQTKVEMTVQTETITCLTVTGPRMDILVAGCHSGNLVSINTKQRSKKETC